MTTEIQLTTFEPRLPLEYINKFSGHASPAIYELSFKDFQKQVFVRKVTGTPEYPMRGYEVGNSITGITIDTSIEAKTESDALCEIFMELRFSMAHYRAPKERVVTSYLVL